MANKEQEPSAAPAANKEQEPSANREPLVDQGYSSEPPSAYDDHPAAQIAEPADEIQIDQIETIEPVAAELNAEPVIKAIPEAPRLVADNSAVVASVNINPGQLTSSEEWIAVFAELPLQGMLKSICGQLSFRQRDNDRIAFDIDASVSGVLSDKYQAKFAEILSGHLNQSLQVVIESSDNPNESPTARAARLHAEALESAEAELLDSDTAQILTETFNAKLVPGSVNLK